MIKKFYIHTLTLSFIALFAIASSAHAQSVFDEPLETRAQQAIIVDFDTGDVLFEKNADDKMPTSSMSKTLTMYAVFDALKKGEISLDDTFRVSKKAWAKGGSKMFLEQGRDVRVEDLIRGVIVQSGNDATIVLAENMEGSEVAFAETLNEIAHSLGMKDSHFMNASGWPDPEHYSTARDLSKLGVALIKNFPEYYPYFSEKEYTHNNITQPNRNPLLYRIGGADGIKTGHTDAGGYGLMGSGKFRGRRTIIVLNGLPDETLRSSESAKLLEWGLRHFENKTLFNAGDIIESVPVVLGESKTVNAILKDDMTSTVPRQNISDIKIEVSYDTPLMAPIKKGDKIATMKIMRPNLPVVTKSLYAGHDVKELGLFSKTLYKARMFIADKISPNKTVSTPVVAVAPEKETLETSEEKTEKSAESE